MYKRQVGGFLEELGELLAAGSGGELPLSSDAAEVEPGGGAAFVESGDSVAWLADTDGDGLVDHVTVLNPGGEPTAWRRGEKGWGLAPAVRADDAAGGEGGWGLRDAHTPEKG